MKKITLLLFAVIAFAFSFQTHAQCNYTLEMNDSYGDGWNGNTMDVLVNGTAVLSGVTLSDGAQGTMTFTVNDGDDVTTNWIGGGSFAFETSYRILDFSGTEVGTGAQTSITTGTITASCPTCTLVVVNSETVMPDCGNSQFSVDVDVASVGDGTVITDGLGGSFAVAAGIVTAGPYATSSTVTLTVEHSDPACDFSLGDFSYIDCPTTVMCGTPVNTTYCYGDYDTRQFIYTSSDGSALNVTFNGGGIESCCDDLVVYDSDGTTELYRGANGGDLTGLTFNSTGDTIIVAVDSDVSSSCDSGSQTPQWDWDVTCLACAPAVATVALVPDCGASTYTLEVTVSDTGDATTITDGTTPQAIAASLTFGPYAFGVDTTLDVVHSDGACDYTLGTYGLDACPPANDECADAIALTVNADYACGVVTSGTNVGATASSQVDDVTGTPNNDVWFSFTATATGHRISLLNIVNQPGGSTSVDMGMGVYDATGGCAALVFFDDSDPETLDLTGLTIGTEYYVRVYGWYSTLSYNNFDVCVGTPPTCPAATSLTASNLTETSADLGWTENGTATAWDIEWGANGFTPTGTPNIEDTATNPHTLGGLTTTTSYDFYVRADCGGGDTSAWTGPYTFVTASPPPSNETCATATALQCGDSISGTSAGSAGTQEGSGCTLGANGVWYTFTGYGGDITIDVTASFDHELAITSGTCGALVNVGCEDSSTGAESYTITNSVDGETYYVYIANWSGSSTTTGTHTIALTCPTVSVDDFASSDVFTYYPNPVNNTLSLKGVKTIQDVAVYNMLGQQVLRTAPNTVNSDVDMSNLQAGTYFVKVTIENATKTIKVIKK